MLRRTTQQLVMTIAPAFISYHKLLLLLRSYPKGDKTGDNANATVTLFPVTWAKLTNNLVAPNGSELGSTIIKKYPTTD